MNTDKAVRYHRLKRRADVASTVVTAAVLVALAGTGFSPAMRDFAAAATRGTSGAAASSPLTIALFVVILAAILTAAALPLTYYSGVVLDRRYGLSSETTGRWLGDQAKGALVSVVIGIGAAELVYVTMRRWPTAWWAIAAVGCGVAVLLLARAAPVLLLPIFYRFTPLDRPALQERLRALSERAGLPVLGVYEWGLGARTRRANAALVGVGSTRRILLSDTLLADYSEDEVEVILAHEIAHHAHHDVLKGVAAQTLLLLLGFGLAARALRLAASQNLPAAAGGPADVAALPVVLLAVGLVGVALTPILLALSRRHERRADEYALRLTERPDAFISAMRRLASQNLAEPQPSRLAVWLFHSHPPIDERIEGARRVM